MPRTNNDTELFRNLTRVDFYRILIGTPADTTTTVAVAVGDATATVASSANFANGDPAFIVGDGGMELAIINNAPALAMPLSRKLAIPQSIGARFVKAVKTYAGKTDANGFQFGGDAAMTAIMSGDQRLPVGYYFDKGEISFDMALLGFSIENLQLTMGMTESVTGTGVTADPWQGAVAGSSLGQHELMCVRVTGVRMDGRTVEFDFLNAKVGPSGKNQLKQQAGVSYGLTGKATALIKRVW
jgi:hypothetical protein